MTTTGGRIAAGAVAALLCGGFAAPADAGGLGELGLGGLGLGGPGLGLPSLPGTSNLSGTLGPITSRTTGALGQDTTVLRDAVGRPRLSRAAEKDANGLKIVRGEILALSPSDQSLAIARGLNFAVTRQDRLDALGLTIAVLGAPNGMSASDALIALRKADPAGAYDVDHIYDPSGASAGGAASAPAQAPPQQTAIRIGMIDGGVDAAHDAFAHASIMTQGFVTGGSAVATRHGTEVASLLVGADSDVAGALPGAKLYAADVYCGQAAGGSADAIARALGWLAADDVPVVNISLAGPPNAILEAAVKAFVKRGHVLVAAAGNDGPAAPVEYPAGYAGVAGVTSVDDRHSVQLEANRGPDIAFAALGVDVAVAAPKDHHDTVSGTSFAVPIVAARFAQLLARPDPNAAAQAWTELEHTAIHLGPPGRNDIFGYGYLDRSPSNTTAAK
jgi:hypothetical protein